MPAPCGPPGPTPPEPFTLSFDSDDACFSAEVSDVLATLPPTVRSALGDTVDADALVRALESLAAHRSEEDPQSSDAVGLALAELRGCQSYCTCGPDRWQDDRDLFDEALAELPDGDWAVSRGGTPVDDAYGTFTVSGLYAMLSRRDGWDALTLEWDGQRLRAVFRAHGQGSDCLELRPLSDEQSRIRGLWDESDWDLECPASVVLDHPLDLLVQAEELHRELEDARPSDPWNFTEVVEALKEVDHQPTDAHREVAFGLASNWEGTLGDLLRSAALLHPDGLAA